MQYPRPHCSLAVSGSTRSWIDIGVWYCGSWTLFHTAPSSPSTFPGREVIADPHPHHVALPSPPPLLPPQTHPMSDDQHSGPLCRVADSLEEEPHREQQMLQHEASYWEIATSGPQQHSYSGWSGPAWEQAQLAASPAHSASAYAWCCEDDIALTNDTSHRSVASFGGYSLGVLSPELSLAGSPAAIGSCAADPGDCVAVLRSRPDQPLTCSQDANSVIQSLQGVSEEGAAGHMHAEELRDARSAIEAHFGGGGTAATSAAIMSALRTEQSCQETRPQPLLAMSGGSNPQLVSAGDFMQLDISHACHGDGAQLQPPSSSALPHAITAL